jgi:NAD/NADP transhydrogenase alpha subunit
MEKYRQRTFRADYRFHIAKMRLWTAAGTITRSHAIVIGAGVAGRQPIGTARQLRAVVKSRREPRMSSSA